MVTDRRPSRAGLRQEYDASTRLTLIQVPGPDILGAFMGELESARDVEERAPLTEACTKILAAFSEFYGVPRPTLKLLGVRPHRTREGHLSSETLGDYTLDSMRIRLWTRTPMIKRWTSTRTILSTLCHEFMHHLDVTQLELPKTYHTTGFFERTHRLYLGVTGQPYYPLAWHPPERNGSCAIDWPATNRRRALSALAPRD